MARQQDDLTISSSSLLLPPPPPLSSRAVPPSPVTPPQWHRNAGAGEGHYHGTRVSRNEASARKWKNESSGNSMNDKKSKAPRSKYETWFVPYNISKNVSTFKSIRANIKRARNGCLALYKRVETWTYNISTLEEKMEADIWKSEMLFLEECESWVKVITSCGNVYKICRKRRKYDVINGKHLQQKLLLENKMITDQLMFSQKKIWTNAMRSSLNTKFPSTWIINQL